MIGTNLATILRLYNDILNQKLKIAYGDIQCAEKKVKRVHVVLMN